MYKNLNNSNQNVLILGATGFIGGHIARAALKMNWHVRGLRRKPGMTGHLGADAPLEWMEGDLDDPDSLLQAMRGIDTVFHAAGYYPARQEKRSVFEQVSYALRQTANVMESCRRAGIKQLVYTSTLTTIGRPPSGARREANEEDYYIPGSVAKSAYYEAKSAMEQSFLQASKDGFRVVVLNPTAVFGPGDVHLSLGGLLLAVARGWALGWLPVTINIVDVRDVASAHIQAAIQGRPGERYIIGGHNLTLKDALTQAASIAKVHPPRFEIPLVFIDALVRLDDILPFVNLSGNHLRTIRLWPAYDISKARRELSLSPRPLEETVRDSLDWFRSQGLLPTRHSEVQDVLQ